MKLKLEKMVTGFRLGLSILAMVSVALPVSAADSTSSLVAGLFQETANASRRAESAEGFVLAIAGPLLSVDDRAFVHEQLAQQKPPQIMTLRNELRIRMAGATQRITFDPAHDGFQIDGQTVDWEKEMARWRQGNGAGLNLRLRFAQKLGARANSSRLESLMDLLVPSSKASPLLAVLALPAVTELVTVATLYSFFGVTYSASGCLWGINHRSENESIPSACVDKTTEALKDYWDMTKSVPSKIGGLVESTKQLGNDLATMNGFRLNCLKDGDYELLGRDLGRDSETLFSYRISRVESDWSRIPYKYWYYPANIRSSRGRGNGLGQGVDLGMNETPEQTAAGIAKMFGVKRGTKDLAFLILEHEERKSFCEAHPNTSGTYLKSKFAQTSRVGKTAGATVAGTGSAGASTAQ